MDFDGPAEEGRQLILVPRPRAQVWVFEVHPAPGHKYGHYVLTLYPLLSLISFDRVRLKGTEFLIEFPEDNLHEGTHAQLGVQFLEAPNQLWKITLGESYFQELSCHSFIFELISPSS